MHFVQCTGHSERAHPSDSVYIDPVAQTGQIKFRVVFVHIENGQIFFY